MGLNLTGVFGDISNLASSVSGQDVLNGLLASTAGTVLVAGAQSSAGQDAIDPLHWFHHTAANGTTASGVVAGNVMTMSQFQALGPDGQKIAAAMKFTVIPG